MPGIDACSEKQRVEVLDSRSRMQIVSFPYRKL